MSSELGVKCESELGAAIESELGVRDCAGGVLYIYTTKAATSEAFLYRVDANNGTVIYKINLWTVLDIPATINDRIHSHIRIDASGEHVYINRTSRLTKIKAGIGVALIDRVVWDVPDTAITGGEHGISSDGDIRSGSGRVNKDTGVFTWGGPNGRMGAVDLSDKTYFRNSTFVFKLDADGNTDWFHQIPINFPEQAQLIQGIEVANNGNVWVAYTTVRLIGGGPNVENLYRLRMLDAADGTLIANQPWLNGEVPDINGQSFGVEVRPSGRGRCSWIYAIFAGPAIWRMKLIDEQNSEISTTDILTAQRPLQWEPSKTGTFVYRSGTLGSDLDKVYKTTEILTTDIWNVQLDAAVDSVWIGAKE